MTMRLSSSSCMRAKTASRASRLPASRSSPMPYSTPRTDRVFGSAAADQHLAPVGASEEGARIYRAHRMLQFAPRWRGPAAETGRPGPTFSCARGALRSAAHPARRPSRAVRPPRSARLARRPRQSFTALPRAPGASACRPCSASPPPPWPGKRRCWSPKVPRWQAQVATCAWFRACDWP